ncbi:macro domain-containing protein [Chitinophagaceae bacterium LWZ2-11]
MKIEYIKGDATAPIAPGNKIIVHICNDIGGWGKGFVVAISKRWKEPEMKYREWYNSKVDFSLGEAQFVQVEKEVWVANVIGQHKISYSGAGVAPIRYDAVAEGLQKVGVFAKEINASVHMPRIGCGLAGGTWDKIEPLIKDAITSIEIPVIVYDF